MNRLSENDLVIRVILDPSQFRDEFSRLRRDLEQESRIDIDSGEVRAGTGVPITTTQQSEVAPLPTQITVSETDPLLESRISTMENMLQRKLGLPTVFDQMSPNDMVELLKGAFKMPGWKKILKEEVYKGVADDFSSVAQEAARRYGDKSIADIRDLIKDPHTTGALQRIYDAIYRISGIETTPRAVGLRAPAEEAVRMMALIERQTFTDAQGSAYVSITHRAIQEEIAELIKIQKGEHIDPILEARLGSEGLRSIMDVYATYSGQLTGADREGVGIITSEVKTTKVGQAVVDQVAKQFLVLFDELKSITTGGEQVTDEEFLKTIIEEGRILGDSSTSAGRIKLVLTSLQEGKSIQGKVMDTILKTQRGTEVNALFRKAFEKGVFEFPQITLPKDLQKLIMEAWGKEDLSTDDVRNIMRTFWASGEEQEEFNEMILSVLNPTFGEERFNRAREMLTTALGTSNIQSRKRAVHESLNKMLESGTSELGSGNLILRAITDVLGIEESDLAEGLRKRSRSGRSVREQQLRKRIKDRLPEITDRIVSLDLQEKIDMMESSLFGSRLEIPEVDAKNRYTTLRKKLNEWQKDWEGIDPMLAEVFYDEWREDDEFENVEHAADISTLRETYRNLFKIQLLDRRKEIVKKLMPTSEKGLGVDIDWDEYLIGVKRVAEQYGMTTDEYIEFISRRTEGTIFKTMKEGLSVSLQTSMVDYGRELKFVDPVTGENRFVQTKTDFGQWQKYIIEQGIEYGVGRTRIDQILRQGISGKGTELQKLLIKTWEAEASEDETIDDFLAGYSEDEFKKLMNDLSGLMKDDQLKGIVGETNMKGFTKLRRDAYLFEHASMELAPFTNDALNWWT